jgi:hypothetical protein
MNGPSAFSPDYRTARARFREQAVARGMRLEAHPLPGGHDLTVDVAFLGDDQAERVVIVSSGLHGVEGFLGSAIQLAWLDDPAQFPDPPPGSALVLIHALDPYGFAKLRRVDADNVDLNRNFVLEPDTFSGCPETYRALDGMLNPRWPPSWFDPYPVDSLVALMRFGRGELKRAIAHGQYEFPLGLFFGGKGPAPTRRLLERELPRWVNGAEQVLHLDVHTGLGPSGSLAFLLDGSVPLERVAWLRERFGHERVVWSGEGVSYPTSGGLGSWCQAKFPGVAYDYLCAEFGTWGGSSVLAALRRENQADHWGEPGSESTARAKARLREAFAPSDPAWRERTVREGLASIQRAFEVAARSPVEA